MEPTLQTVLDDLYRSLPADSTVSAQLVQGLMSGMDPETEDLSIGTSIVVLTRAVIALEAKLHSQAAPQ